MVDSIDDYSIRSKNFARRLGDLALQRQSDNGVYTPTPTEQTYDPLLAAFTHFNRDLFGGALPDCLITLQRKANTYGYFSPRKFAAIGGDARADEIALNPAHFRVCTPRGVCSTLVHEMVHLWQEHFGKPPRSGYHDRQWAAAMHRIGLHPSSTAGPGGKETGYHVSDFVVEGGPFDRSYRAFEASGLTIGWGDAFIAQGEETRKSKRDPYVCPGCGLKAYCVANARIRCDRCDQLMAARHKDETADGDAGTVSDSIGAGELS